MSDFPYCELQDAALRWVNRVRRLLGCRPLRQLPAGVAGDEYRHPLALAMPHTAAVRPDGRVELLGVRLVLEPDPAACEFVVGFAAGQYPDLIDFDAELELLLADINAWREEEDDRMDDLWDELGLDDLL